MCNLGAFCERCIPEGINPPPDLWLFVYKLRWAVLENEMEEKGCFDELRN